MAFVLQLLYWFCQFVADKILKVADKKDKNTILLTLY